MVVHVFGWFTELSATRGSNGFGANPIGYRDIADWSRLTGELPTPFEVSCILALDSAFLRSRALKDKGKAAK